MANTLQSVERAIRVLEGFTPEEPRLGLSQLVARFGWRKSTLHRLVNSLVRSGMLSKDATTRQYALSYKVVWLARAVALHRELQAVAGPIMRNLRDRTGETVTLSVVGGRERVVIQQVEGAKGIRYVEEVGVRRPLYCGASGKLLLAYLPDEEARVVLGAGPLRRYTRMTITDPQRLRRELQLIRDRGYALSYGEYSEGACAIAAPIVGSGGQVVACVAVLGPRDRIPDSRVHQFRAMLLGAVKQVTETLSQPPALIPARRVGRSAQRAPR